MATLNTCEWFGLYDRGAIAPGRFADLMIFDDLKKPTAREVFVNGTSIRQAGPSGPGPIPEPMMGFFHVDPACVDLRIRAKSKRIRVIGSQPDQLVTESLVRDARIVDGLAEADPSSDILKIAVIERHRGSGNIGLGFIQGFGLKRGAIAGTVAHDHHNLIVIGADDRSMHTAIEWICRACGGLVVTDGEQVLENLRLPVAGLMSDQPIEQVRIEYDGLVHAARKLGGTLRDPFMAMSFMALEVIPKLKLADKGLVDVERFKLVDLFV
jgi:adenine deaminase